MGQVLQLLIMGGGSAISSSPQCLRLLQLGGEVVRTAVLCVLTQWVIIDNQRRKAITIVSRRKVLIILPGAFEYLLIIAERPASSLVNHERKRAVIQGARPVA